MAVYYRSSRQNDLSSLPVPVFSSLLRPALRPRAIAIALGVACAGWSSPVAAQQAQLARMAITARELADARAGRAAPFSALSASAVSLRDSIVARARAQVGRRYRLGGASPEHGFDCSGLVRYVVAALGLEVPRTAIRQASVGSAVQMDTTHLRPGDLLTFGYNHKVSHIGIYVGNGRFIQASSVAGRVVETQLMRKPARRIKPWQGARRLVATADSASAR